MTKIADNILNKLNNKLNKSIKQEINFFDKPISLKNLFLVSIGTFTMLSNDIKNKIYNKLSFDINDNKKLRSHIKDNKFLNNIINTSNSILDEDILSEMLLKCETIHNNEKEFESLKNYKKIYDTERDISSKINNIKQSAVFIFNDNIKYISIGLMTYYIINMILDMLNNTEYPSRYRTKYIQKLIRVTLANIWDNVSEEYADIKNNLIQIDEILVALSVASVLYLYNIKQSQRYSEKLLAEKGCRSSESTENVYRGERDITIKKREINENFKCPIDQDIDPVPKEPYENKLSRFTCSIPGQDDFDEITTSKLVDAASKALIVNKKTGNFISKKTEGSYVDQGTVIATLESRSIHSPVSGHINILTKDRIELERISEDSMSNLDQEIENLKNKYEELNIIKDFLKEWEVLLMYPISLYLSELSGYASGGKTNYGVQHFEMFKSLITEWEKRKERYERDIKQLTDPGNIKEISENNKLTEFKQDIDEKQASLFNFLSYKYKDYKENSPYMIFDDDDFILLQYYLFDIKMKISSIKSLNYLESDLKNKIDSYIDKRFYIEKFDKDKLKNKGIKLLSTFSKSLFSGGSLWEKGVEIFNKSNEINEISKWLDTIGDNDINKFEFDKFKKSILFIYETFLKIKNIEEDRENVNDINAIKKQTIIEGKELMSFLDNIWDKYNNLPDEISLIEKKIDDLSLLSRYHIREIDGEQYRVYTIENDKEDTCQSTLINRQPYTIDDFEYWIKYCSIATLGSVVNPASGWSTGIILPTGPLKVPTVYIPIKPIRTNYGFFLLGLTVTGIWVYPLVLFVNLTGDFAIPISSMDPTNLLKKQIESLKQEVSNELKSFRNISLKGYLDDKKDVIKNLENDIESLEYNLSNHRLNRPAEIEKEDFRSWKKIETEIKTEMLKKKTEKWILEKKYIIVNSVYSGYESIKSKDDDIDDTELKSFSNLEEKINSKLDKIISLLDKINDLKIAIPGVMNPYSVNFGFTPKKPSPSIKIEDELNDNINEGPLNNLLDKFKLNNEDNMEDGAKFDYDKFQTALMVAIPTIIKKDPFPSYDNLKVTNIPFISFIYKSFVPTGAKTFGIPGQLPI